MDSWLKQEALKNPDIKRLAHEEHTSGNKSTHLPLCSARSRAHINLVSIFVGSSESVQSATRQGAGRPGPAGIRFCSRGVKTLHIHALPFDLGRSDCKCLLKILRPRHLATKQENYKTSQLIFYFWTNIKFKNSKQWATKSVFAFCFFFCLI